MALLHRRVIQPFSGLPIRKTGEGRLYRDHSAAVGEPKSS
jgi:hypothetical protein